MKKRDNVSPGAPGKTATIRELASRAGTSTATVSRVLNSTGFVSDELKARVLEASRALGYHPNAIARGFRRQKTQTIGVIINDIANPFFGHVVRGIEEVLAPLGYHQLLCNTDGDVEKERMFVRLLCEKRVEGVIISAAGKQAEHLQILKDQKLPWVFVNRRPPGFGGPAVLTDNRAGVFEAVKHFIDLGHRSIAIIAGPQSINTGADRLKGYLDAMKSRGLGVSPELIYFGDFQEASGYQGVWELMALPPEKLPTAIFICNNFMAAGAWKALIDLDVRVPGDMALAAFDETEWARIVNPPLTTVAQPSHEMGLAAARILFKLISRNRPPDQEADFEDVYLKPRLIVRESCGAKPDGKVEPR